MNEIRSETRSHPLNHWFSRVLRLNPETLFYLVILLLAIFTRFYMLGERVMSHDESLHTRFSYNLYADGDYQHTPLMHGPVLFHAVALSYYLFGDSDFSARIYPAVLGVLMVLSPLLFRRWLGRWGTILATLMLLISPLVLYYNRYIREDTPNLFYAILMMWAILQYLNGAENQRRREHWLYVLAASMILCLASKETAFIYILIFFSFLFLYWVARLAQHFLHVPGKTVFYLTMMGMLTGGVLSLAMYTILDVVKFDLFGGASQVNFSGLAPADQQTFLLWTFLAILALVVVIVGTLLWAYRDRMEKIRWSEVAYILGIMFVMCLVFVIFEEGSHLQPDSTQTAAPLVPGEEGSTAVVESTIRWLPMIATWLGSALVLGFLWIVRRRPEVETDGKDKYGRGFWGTLDLFPEFDLIILIGTLILPWATAVIPFVMKGTASDFISIANTLPQPIYGLIDNFPNINTADQVGQIVLGAMAFLPLMVVAIVVGISWNLRKWLIAAGIFHAIFAFFFTTVFTNIAGLGTGMIYSLGYWLEQQGVRRGSQPQYYYLILIMPFYEFLPVIGSVLAMISGYIFFWRWREAQSEIDASTALSSLESAESGMLSESLPVIESPEESGVTESFEESPAEPLNLSEKERNRLINKRTRQLNWGNPLFWILIAPAIGVPALNLLLMSGGYQLGFLVHLAGFAAAGGAIFMVFRNRAQAKRDVDEALAAGRTDFAGVKSKHRPEQPETEAEPVPVDNFLWQYRQRRLEEVPFLFFISWLAVLNLIMYSLAGEKMPWLAIHLTYPMIFVTAWFFGRSFSRMNWNMVRENGWMMLVALPLVTITLIQVVVPSLIGRGPFQGLNTTQLNQTYAWLAAFMATGAGIAFVLWVVQRTSWTLLRQGIAVTTFSLLALITFRSAWMAAFINYDYPTEFIVYAHAAPAIKWALNEIEDLSLRTTDGMDLKFAYDNSVSWPYSWYFRHFRNAVFVGENPTVQNLDGAVVVVVGDDKRSKVEPILEDQYIRFDHMRLWWPMQDYFNLTATRINNALDFSPANAQAAQIREGMFDIWWNRDYTTYGKAVEKDFSVTNWPVADVMHVYIRRDVAKQVWQYGTGDGSVFTEEPEVVNLCRTNWLSDKAAVSVMQASPQPMNRPLGITVDANGNLYVAEEFGHRIAVFDANGQYTGSIGQEGSGAGAFFNRPNDVYAAPDGSLYVADTWNYRIIHMTADGTLLQQWGQNYSVGFGAESTPTDGFWGPRDVALDSTGQVYVSDTGNKRIRVYALDGSTPVYRFDVGKGGSGQGELDEPNTVVVHPVDGRIFVIDTWNRRISVFNKEGGFLTSFPVRAWYNKDSGSLPFMALDATRDMLYVGDPEAGRVMVFNTAGECLGSFGSPAGEAPTNAQFNIVSGLAVDKDGNVYVADAGLNRVLKFTPFEVPNPAAGLNLPDGVVVDQDGKVISEGDGQAQNGAEVTVEVDTGQG